MADGEVRVTLDDESLRRLAEAAKAAGRPVEGYAADLILVGLSVDDDWAADVAAVAEAERTGQWHTVEDAMAAFDEALEAHFKSKS